MNIGWPAAIVLATLIMGGVILLVSQMATRGSIATEEAKGKYGEQYRMLAADYEKLAKETKDAESAIQADVAVLREKVDSMERMMREVG
jgi:polyhydroxyalkanoate synthesis regulator phasin